MAIGIGRREFIALVGGAAAWAPAAYAQQRVRTMGVLLGLASNDPEIQARIRAFERGLEALGWIIGRNLRIEYRFAESDIGRMRTLGKELVDLHPDVILAHSTAVTAALLQATRTVPIVFVVVSDPIGSGFVASMARPGGNATGFTSHGSTIVGKFLDLLKRIAPDVSRVALMFNPKSATFAESFYLRPFLAAASSFAIEPVAALVHDTAEIERTMAALGHEPGGGLIVVTDNFTTVNRKLIIALAAQHRVPAIYPYRYFCTDGGLMAYGVDLMDLFRRAASYVDRVLKGTKPADLPVQSPTKFEFVINLKTANALGLTVPQILRTAVDVVIE
jgi:putative tryptophan/tyrosine transport system substrate-binding protein